MSQPRFPTTSVCLGRAHSTLAPHLLFPHAQPCALFTVSPVGILPALLLHQIALQMPLRVPAARCQEGSWIQLPMDMGHHNVLETEKLP